MNSSNKTKRRAATAGVAAVVVFLILAALMNSGSTPMTSAPLTEREIEINVIVDASPPPVPKIKSSQRQHHSEDKGGGNDGEFPPINANYHNRVGFARYADALVRRGALFLVVDVNDRLFMKIDLNHRSLRRISLETIKSGDFSPRTRHIGDEPALNEYLAMARRQGAVDPEVILLFPNALERKITGTISAALRRAGTTPGQFHGFRGEYDVRNGSLVLNVREAASRRGVSPLNVTVPL